MSEEENRAAEFWGLLIIITAPISSLVYDVYDPEIGPITMALIMLPINFFLFNLILYIEEVFDFELGG